MTDFFSDQMGTLVANHYPGTRAGFKKEGTSQLAAESVEPFLNHLQRLVLKQIEGRNLTADEVAGQLGLSILTVRPRLSELSKLGKIAETDERRPNQSGRLASVWKAI